MRKFRMSGSLVIVSLVTLFVLPGNAKAQVVVYSTFGPGMSFATFASSTEFVPPPFSDTIFCCREAATSFVSNGDFSLSKIDMALTYNSNDILGDPNTTNIGVIVELFSDSGGKPGNILESWTIPSLPIWGTTSTVSIAPTSSIQLTSGNRYWLAILPAGNDGWASWNNNSNSLVGTVIFGNDGINWTFVTQPLPAFDVLGAPTGRTKFGYTHKGLGQTVRLTVVAGPGNVPPGVPVEAVLGFLDANGNSTGPSKVVNLVPGQAQSLDFGPALPVGAEVLPIVSLPPGAAAFAGPIQASVEVFDDLTGFGQVFLPGSISLPSTPLFVPQGLAAGQSMRITVFAYPPDPCAATLSFQDSNGNPVGPALPVSLNGRQSASLDLNAEVLSLRLGQRVEVQPVVTLTPSVGTAAPQTLACPASVDTFDHLTGRTETYQPGEINPGPPQ